MTPLSKQELEQMKSDALAKLNRKDRPKSFELYLPDRDELPAILRRLTQQRCLFIVDQRDPSKPVLMVQTGSSLDR